MATWTLLNRFYPRFFKQYDTNSNGVLEYAEVKRLANDLFLALGISLDEERVKERFSAATTEVDVINAYRCKNSSSHLLTVSDSISKRTGWSPTDHGSEFERIKK